MNNATNTISVLVNGQTFFIPAHRIPELIRLLSSWNVLAKEPNPPITDSNRSYIGGITPDIRWPGQSLINE